MLKGEYKVILLTFTDKAYLLPFYAFYQLVQLILILPFTSKYLCFFAGYHTVIPVLLGKIFNKKVIIQCGGTDAMHLPHIDYGNYRKKWLKLATVFSFKNCSLILPVSRALVKSDYKFDPNAPHAQGLLNLIPNLKTTIEVVPNGFDYGFWKDVKEKEPFTFVTVATGISKKNRALVKGIDLLLEAAAHFRNYNFILIGDEHFRTDLTNVKVLPKLNQNEIRDYFQKTQFYLQLSASEGFPNALAEAMLCGCVPIGSDVGEIPEIIGSAGFILFKKEISQLIQILNRLPEHDLYALRKKATESIQHRYGYEIRKKKLIQILR